MLTPDQTSELHCLHCVEKWPSRKIARHMRIGRRAIAKYLNTPAAKAAHRDRARKLDPFKPIIGELLQQDPCTERQPRGWLESVNSSGAQLRSNFDNSSYGRLL